MEADDVVNNCKFEDISSLMRTHDVTSNRAIGLFNIINECGYYEDITLKFSDCFNVAMMEAFVSTNMRMEDFLKEYGTKNLMPVFFYTMLDMFVKNGGKLENTFDDMESNNVNGFDGLSEDVKNIFYIATSASKVISKVYCGGEVNHTYVPYKEDIEISSNIKKLYIAYYEFFYSNGKTSNDQDIVKKEEVTEKVEKPVVEKTKKSTPRRKTIDKKITEINPEVSNTVKTEEKIDADEIGKSIIRAMAEYWITDDKEWKEFTDLPLFGISDSDKKSILEKLSSKFELKLVLDSKTFDRYNLHIKIK